MRKAYKKVSILLLFIVIVFCLGTMVSCVKSSSDFTVDQHIERITERVEKKFMKNKNKYDAFSVYPLYNKNDELQYFLIEFEPEGYIYVLLQDEKTKLLSIFGASTSMYLMATASEWSPYTLDKTNKQPEPDTNKIWHTDENGNKITYNVSPYKVANRLEDKKYLLQTISQEENGSEPYYIPAIKLETNYFNLISNNEFGTEEKLLYDKHEVQWLQFIPKKDLDL